MRIVYLHFISISAISDRSHSEFFRDHRRSLILIRAYAISSRSMVVSERDGSRWPGQKRTRAGINARQLRTMVVTAPREPRGIYRTDHRRGKKVGINGGRVQYENKTLLKKPLRADPTCPSLCCPGKWKMLPATKPLRGMRLEHFAMLSRGSRENWAVPSTRPLIVSLSSIL